MRVKMIVLMMMLSWMWDLPIALYAGAPPLIPIRGKPATDQPLNRGISQHTAYNRNRRRHFMRPVTLLRAVAFVIFSKLKVAKGSCQSM